MPKTVAATSQGRSDRKFPRSFSDDARQSNLVFLLRVQIGVLEQQLEDERMTAYLSIAIVAIACTILGRLL